MCFLDSPVRMGSERFWAREVVITTIMVYEMTLNTLLGCREVDPVIRCSDSPLETEVLMPPPVGSVGC